MQRLGGEEMDRKTKNRVLLFLPITIMSCYLLITLLILFFGLIRWKISSPFTLAFYVLLCYLSLVSGYIVYLNIYKKRMNINNVEENELIKSEDKITKIVIVFSLIVTSWYVLSNLIFFIGINNIFIFLRNPSKGYDYFKMIQRLISNGYHISVPLIGRVGFWLNLLFSGVNALIIPIIYYNNNRMTKPYKTIAYIIVMINLTYSIIIGIQSSLIIFALTLVLLNLINICEYIVASNEINIHNFISEMKWKICIVIIALILVFSTLGSYQSGRKDLYDKRTAMINEITAKNMRAQYNIEEFYLYSIFGCDYESQVTESLLDFVRSQVAYKGEIHNLCSVRDNIVDIEMTAQAQENSHPPVSKGNKEATQTEEVVDKKKQYILDIEETLRPLKKYFVIKNNDLLYSIVGDSNMYKIVSIEFYLTHGYYGLNLAMGLPFKASFPMGSLRGLKDYVDVLIDTNKLIKNTYEFRIYEEFGWSNTTYWPTSITSYSSDFTFVGAIVIMFMIGFAYAISWTKTIQRKNYIYFSIFMILSLHILMLPANNFIGNSAYNIFSVGVYVFLLIIINFRAILNSIEKRRS